MHTQGSSTFVPVNKVFFNYDSNFQHKKTEAGWSYPRQVDSCKKRLCSHRDSIFNRSSMIKPFLESFVVVMIDVCFNSLN